MKDIGVAPLKYILVLAVILLGLLSLPANAASIEDTIASLAKANTKQKIQAIKDISASSHGRAADILQALTDSKLYYQKSDKKVIIIKKAGSTSAITLTTCHLPTPVKPR